MKINVILQLLLMPYVIAGFLFMFAASSAASAQGPQFKVGDRVEVDTLQSSTNPEKSFYWRGGTVTSIGDPNGHFGYYVIKIDDGGTRTLASFDWASADASAAT